MGDEINFALLKCCLKRAKLQYVAERESAITTIKDILKSPEVSIKTIV